MAKPHLFQFEKFMPRGHKNRRSKHPPQKLEIQTINVACAYTGLIEIKQIDNHRNKQDCIHHLKCWMHTETYTGEMYFPLKANTTKTTTLSICDYNQMHTTAVMRKEVGSKHELRPKKPRTIKAMGQEMALDQTEILYLVQYTCNSTTPK